MQPEKYSEKVLRVGPGDFVLPAMPVRPLACIAIAILLFPQDEPVRAQGAGMAQASVLPYLSSGFGYRRHPISGGVRFHTGIDIPAANGTPVRASASGEVRIAAYTGGYGLMVELDHGAAVRTRYAHLSRMLVQPGERIEAGQVIGLVGSTGRSTGNHLHFEVRRGGLALDPIPFLGAASPAVAITSARKIESAPLTATAPHISEYAKARAQSAALFGEGQ